MQITRRSSGDIQIVTLSGTLDASVASKVRDELKELIASGQHRLVIDLEGVSFIDSSGLSALVTGFKMARAAGGDVALANVAPPVRSIVELTRLHRIMDIFDDAEAAAQKLAV
jgi:anti-anti-sigma factor